MFVQILKNKIHRARLTSCDLNYEGSLEIDMDYLEQAGILPYEKILVVNATNGQRLETYAIPGERGKGVFCLNGAAAHRGKPGDIVTIMTFAVMTPEEAAGYEPTVIVLDEKNRITAKRKGRKELPLP
jgi:aspartate 1-decarboxylase